MDSVKYKSQIIESYFYLITYNNDVKKDREAALDYTNKILAIEPTNANALQIKGILERAGNRPATQPARPKSGSNAAGTGTGAKSPAKK